MLFSILSFMCCEKCFYKNADWLMINTLKSQINTDIEQQLFFV